MSDWAFYAAFLLAASFMIFNGILMAAAPAKHRRFLARMVGADSLPHPVRENTRLGLDIERRLAGIGLAALGIYFAWHMILNIAPSKLQPDPRPTLSNIGDNLFSLVLGLCLVVSGVFITIKPGPVVQWSRARQPIPVDVPAHTLVVWGRGARLLGAVLIVGGLYALWAALKTQ